MPSFQFAPSVRRYAFAVLALVAFSGSRVVTQAATQSRRTISDAEFWKFFVTRSEPDGSFLSENFVSNEVSFQEVIPTLQKTLSPNGVYLGVGPEQNFTYIANLSPQLAVIFDIRRQNAMQHLMYKALFEMSPTRAAFVATLFSRPAVGGLTADIPVNALFDSAVKATPNDSAYQANLQSIVERLTVKHGFALSADDIASIEHVYHVFFAAGPDVNYGYRAGMPGYVRTTYPTFASLQSATNADSVRMAFMSTDEHYSTVRDMQLRNLIIPVVGDFGGPKAIRAVADYLRERNMVVTAFYVSNVEQYLFRGSGDAAERFYGNVSALPLDSTSRFIRSVPRTGPSNVVFGQGMSGSAPGTFRLIYRDSVGIRTVQITQDSAGTMVTRTTRDSAGVTRTITARDSVLANIGNTLTFRRDSITRANAAWASPAGTRTLTYNVMGGLLASGLASMQETLQAHFMGELKTYNAVIERTRIGGWSK